MLPSSDPNIMMRLLRGLDVQASKMFELSIYTHGNREYAVAMARLLDPQKQLFAERIISAVSSACDSSVHGPLEHRRCGQGPHIWRLLSVLELPP